MATLRKVKEKLKNIIQKKKKIPIGSRRQNRIVGLTKKVASKISQKTKVKGVSLKQKNEIIGANETAIERTKFSHPESTRLSRGMLKELPSEYGQDKLILQVRDPWWIHAYWEIRNDTLDKFRNELKDEFYKAKRVLRVYDVSNIIFNGSNAHRFFDVHINEYANSWYIDTAGPGRSWCVDLGLLLADGRFMTILRSNTILTPSDGPSWVTDEEWMIPEDMFARLYGMGFGFGRSSHVGKAWRERVLSSPGIASMASPVKKMPKERKFWLVVDTELIVYGATEPDAKVTVQGREIKLRPDGTFTLRFALPDGKQVIPVKAISSDNEEERTITPIVTRETKR